MNELLLLFIVLNIANVMLQTLKTICTVKGGKLTAAFMNAVAFGFYTIVIVYTMCDLPLLTKAVIVGVCNLVGVYIIKCIEEKKLKDKLWKIEFTVKDCCFSEVLKYLEEVNIPFNYVKMPQHYIAFNSFCTSKEETERIKNVINKYGAKYFVSESKSLLQ